MGKIVARRWPSYGLMMEYRGWREDSTHASTSHVRARVCVCVCGAGPQAKTPHREQVWCNPLHAGASAAQARGRHGRGAVSEQVYAV